MFVTLNLVLPCDNVFTVDSSYAVNSYVCTVNIHSGIVSTNVVVCRCADMKLQLKVTYRSDPDNSKWFVTMTLV